LIIHSDPLAHHAGLTASVTGSGPDVVLVHGSLGDYRQWDSSAELLRARYCVVALSRRYHWPNPAPSRGAHYTYETHRDDLLRYLHARARPVHLVGHSYGAGVALLAALRDPSRIQTLVLIEPAFHSLLPTEWPGVDAEVASRSAMLGNVQSLAAADHDEEAARDLMDWLQGGADGFTSLPPPVQSGLLENAKTVGPTFAHAAPNVRCEELRRLRVPTLVLNGERTRLYYRLIGEHLASCLARGTHALVASASHMTIVEKPVETAALISSFLSGYT
jgi:non-heme chloroperoxidase